ncbi:MAG: SCO family protein [Kiloniellales bacterium]
MLHIRRTTGAIAAITLQIGVLLSIGAQGQEGVTLGGPFELVDQFGRTQSHRDIHGNYLLIFFGFTHCPDTCPTTLSTVSAALDSFALDSSKRAARVVPVFVTIDPARDTVAVLQDYLANFHHRFVGLTGTPEQIGKMAKSYGAYYAPVPTDTAGDYLMDHSAFILLMGPQGNYLTHFEPDAEATEIAAELDRRVED